MSNLPPIEGDCNNLEESFAWELELKCLFSGVLNIINLKIPLTHPTMVEYTGLTVNSAKILGGDKPRRYSSKYGRLYP